jgi:hypothetical protein
MDLRVARHQALDANDVVGVDSLLELPEFLERFDVSFKLRPVRKPMRRAILRCASVIDIASPLLNRSLA